MPCLIHVSLWATTGPRQSVNTTTKHPRLCMYLIQWISLICRPTECSHPPHQTAHRDESKCMTLVKVK
eukprot:scaffold2707_cov417-Prasinococcus_capsulatus_cf.AAC.27